MKRCSLFYTDFAAVCGVIYVAVLETVNLKYIQVNSFFSFLQVDSV